MHNHFMHALMIFYDFFKAFFSDNSQKHGGIKVQTSISFEYSATLNDFRRCTSRMITHTPAEVSLSLGMLLRFLSVVECWYLCLKKKFSKINLIVKKYLSTRRKILKFLLSRHQRTNLPCEHEMMNGTCRNRITSSFFSHFRRQSSSYVVNISGLDVFKIF